MKWKRKGVLMGIKGITQGPKRHMEEVGSRARGTLSPTLMLASTYLLVHGR